MKDNTATSRGSSRDGGIGIAGGRRLVRAILDALFPVRCGVCGRLFRPVPSTEGRQSSRDPGGEFRREMADVVCGGCMDDFTPIIDPFCDCCGVPFGGPVGDHHRCGDCLLTPPDFGMARAVGIYDGSLRTLIHGVKYGGRIGIARSLGRLLFSAFEAHWPADGDGIDRVIPVPLHARRMRARGFNQAHLLVRDWPRLGAPEGLTVQPRALIRARHTASQVGLSRRRRRQNVKNAFSVTDPESIGGKQVLLVDDVLTTGATVEECVRVLRRAGAKRVDVLTLARVI
jgi:ComF family protein